MGLGADDAPRRLRQGHAQRRHRGGIGETAVEPAGIGMGEHHPQKRIPEARLLLENHLRLPAVDLDRKRHHNQ
jgi:hypothetical protein